MKITHPSGQAYDLFPDTEIELTRYNPFFNDLGEQSVPLSLPATVKNLQLLGHPGRADNVNKPAARINTHIQSGTFAVIARQAILSAQNKGTIETSFYLHEGAFYEKIDNLSLFEIFENQKLEFTDVPAAINFMYTLIPGTDPRFAVFPVFTEQYILNDTTTTTTPQGYFRFKNEVETTENVDGKNITIPVGFYITPFVKVKHVLQEVLAFLGYTLAPSFLDQAPFSNMVFLNDNLDTIVGKRINYIDIVPDITVKELFNVIRKFHIELIPDEVNRIIHLVPFNKVLSDTVSADLSSYAVSRQVVNYHNQYRQLKLTSEQLALPAEISYLSWQNRRYTVNNKISEDQSLDLINLLSKYPSAYLRNVDGYLVRDGFRADKDFTEKIAHLGINYYAGGPLPVEEHSFPDVVPPMVTLTTQSPGFIITHKVYPYAGPGRAMQSKIVFSDYSEEVSNNSPLKPILCLYYNVTTHCKGTTYNYNDAGVKLWDNSIMWNGPDGLFEKFWRSRDTLLRNALLEVQVDAILPEELKMSLSSVKQVMLNSQKYLVSDINYSTKNKSIGTCSLLSTKLQAPVSEAKQASDYFRQRTYRWNLKYSRSVVDQSVYRFVSEPVAFYPPDPTPGQYAAGGRYYEKTYNVEYGRIDFRTGEFEKLSDGTLTVWLEPALY
ncbi:MAG: hypothetical protein EOM59_15955 [Clostridia bacterium]|nr:hypothetical protein [Clostridia bacterium]